MALRWPTETCSINASKPPPNKPPPNKPPPNKPQPNKPPPNKPQPNKQRDGSAADRDRTDEVEAADRGVPAKRVWEGEGWRRTVSENWL
jgi:hypothetical protein